MLHRTPDGLLCVRGNPPAPPCCPYGASVSRPQVAGFLTLAAPSWDPSLPFVMAGAVAVAMLAYQGVMRFRQAGQGGAGAGGGLARRAGAGSE